MPKVKLTDNTDLVISLMGAVQREYLEDGVRLLLGQVKMNTRVDTGQTKGSWQSVILEDRAVVGSDNDNAIWEEFGTGHYALDGNGRKDPWFIPVEGYLGHKRPTFQGQVVVVYGKGGRAYYKTDGKRPNRALYNAQLTTKPQLEKRYKDLLKRELGRFMK